MTAQKGRDLLLKLDESGAGSFVTVAGLRNQALALNAETVDVTHQESAGQWRELLDGGGLKTASLRGAGIFRDQASDAKLRQYFFAGTIRDYQVIIPDFGVIEGPFQIVHLEFSGRHDGELAFEVSLQSAGELAFAGV